MTPPVVWIHRRAPQDSGLSMEFTASLEPKRLKLLHGCARPLYCTVKTYCFSPAMHLRKLCWLTWIRLMHPSSGSVWVSGWLFLWFDSVMLMSVPKGNKFVDCWFRSGMFVGKNPKSATLCVIHFRPVDTNVVYDLCEILHFLLVRIVHEMVGSFVAIPLAISHFLSSSSFLSSFWMRSE